jgi:hypothetical protein
MEPLRRTGAFCARNHSWSQLMLDIVYIALALIFFGLAAGAVPLLDRM